MYGRGMHAKWGCHLAMYRRVTIPIVRRNQSKKRVAAPSELGDFSRRAGRWIARHNLQSSVPRDQNYQGDAGKISVSFK